MTTKQPQTGSYSALGAVVAAFAIGQAIQTSNGAGHPIAFRWLMLGLGALIASAAVGRLGSPSVWLDRLTVGAAGVASLYQLTELASTPPAIYLQNASLFDFMTRLIVVGALGIALLSAKPWLGRLHLPAFLLAFFVLGRWIMEKSPNPAIDVFSETNESLAALAHGINPWGLEMKFRNIYGHTQFYGPGVADSQWIYAGYAYPPLSLYLSWVGSLFGDVRFANLGCLVLAGAAYTLNKGRFGAAAAVMYLTIPRVLFVLEQTWTDVFILALISLVIWSAQTWRKPLPYLVGALFVLKQYMVFLVPLMPLLFDTKWTRKELLTFLAKGFVTGFLINLPFLAWSPAGYFHALFNDAGLPFRADALSFLAMTAENGQPIWPLKLQYLLVLPAYALIYWRGPKGPAGFALGTSLVMCVFFAFSRHAFCNHYFLVAGSACAALAVLVNREDDAAVTPPAGAGS